MTNKAQPEADKQLREEISKVKLWVAGDVGDHETTIGEMSQWSPELMEGLVALIASKVREAEGTTDRLADSLAEKYYQLRIEHNHADMKWYAYYAGRTGRSLFDDKSDWDSCGDTPTEALQALSNITKDKTDE